MFRLETSWQYPDDNNHYISFNENDMIAQVPHPQDSGTVPFFFRNGTNPKGHHGEDILEM